MQALDLLSSTPNLKPLVKIGKRWLRLRLVRGWNKWKVVAGLADKSVLNVSQVAMLKLLTSGIRKKK
jgi:hypothetical protein